MVPPPLPVAQNWPAPGGPGIRPNPAAYPQRNQDGNGRGQVQPMALPGNARVVIEIDGKVISERLLNKPQLTVGRLSGNDVQVPSQRVSRLHARIRWENGTWLLEDAESLNGLIYQGQRVDQLALTNGDRVYIAPKVVLLYETR